MAEESKTMYISAFSTSSFYKPTKAVILYHNIAAEEKIWIRKMTLVTPKPNIGPFLIVISRERGRHPKPSTPNSKPLTLNPKPRNTTT